MENTIKISFSAVTHTGTTYMVNEDRIFANGRFISPSPAEYAQISLETNDSKCFFALSENMEDEESGISLTSDLKKLHQKAMASSKDINVKMDELVQCVEQSSNLLHSVSLGENDIQDKRPSFAGILIDEGHIAAVNLGNCRIYKLEGDTFKLLVNDYKRAERLLKMGIISNEQAEMLSGQQRSSMDEGRSTVKKSDINTLRENTVYLICSNGLAESVNEDIIYDILGSSTGSDEAASQLVAEALKGETDGSITALVIKVERAGEISGTAQYPRPAQHRSLASGTPSRQARVTASKHRRSVDVSRIISVAVLVVLAIAVIFGGYKLWKMISNPEAQSAITEQDKTVQGTESTNEPSTSDNITEDSQDNFIPEEDVDDPAETDVEDNIETIPDPQTDAGVVDGYYTVKSGDMLMVLAKKFYGDESKYKLIMEANKMTNADVIYPGQKLKIPPAE